MADVDWIWNDTSVPYVPKRDKTALIYYLPLSINYVRVPTNIIIAKVHECVHAEMANHFTLQTRFPLINKYDLLATTFE